MLRWFTTSATVKSQPKMASSFFFRQNCTFKDNNTANHLFKAAKEHEKTGNLLEAEKLYNKIIYEVDPSKKEAYDSLVSLLGKRSVFGYSQEKIDKLLNQYTKHLKSDTPYPGATSTMEHKL